MGIFIKGIDMPENCMECPVNDFCYKATVDIASDVPSNIKADWITGRADWCPIVEIPTPHGRLIEEKIVKSKMNDLIISREEAIETLKANYPDACFEQLRDAVDVAISALKQPERKKGKWVRITQGATPEQYICPFCHRTIEAFGIEELLPIRYPYCHCGADMRGEDNV